MSLYTTSDKPKFNPDLKDVPGIYHESADVFSKQKADTLPPHHDCDLKINVEEGVKLLVGSIDPLSAFKQRVSKTLINLQTRFIQPSNSPFGAPVLFIKKRMDHYVIY